MSQTLTTANVIRTHAKKPTNGEQTILSRKKINQKPKEMKVYIQMNTCSMKKQLSFIISHKAAIARTNEKAFSIALIILAAASKSEFINCRRRLRKDRKRTAMRFGHKSFYRFGIRSCLTGGHFACACVHPLNDNSVGASNLMAGNRKLS